MLHARFHVRRARFEARIRIEDACRRGLCTPEEAEAAIAEIERPEQAA